MRILMLVTLSLLATPALAQSITGDAPRYTMTPTENGVIRLDTQSGAVSTCTRSGEGLVCRSAADDRAGLEQEIARLSQENTQLRQRLGKLAENGKPREQLPDDKEVDRALGLLDRFMHHFKGIIDDWRREDNGEQRT